MKRTLESIVEELYESLEWFVETMYFRRNIRTAATIWLVYILLILISIFSVTLGAK